MTRGRLLEIGQLAPGQAVGPYIVEHACGEGGMAWVYRATGPDGQTVALKLVRPELAVEELFLRRFAREVEAALRVDHPHVVPVLDSGEHDGIPYMTQPFIEGGTLHEKLEREGTLELEPAVTLVLQVGKGLGALHDHQLVHRDLKPANILLDGDGSAFVADFGLAKDRDASLLTMPGQAVGSLDYMAPEQIRAEEVTAAADVYSLACVLFECLTGRPPFADREGMQILRAHLSDEPPDPRADRPELPDDLSWAVAQGLHKRAGERPASASGFARMVQVAAGVPPLSPG